MGDKGVIVIDTLGDWDIIGVITDRLKEFDFARVSDVQADVSVAEGPRYANIFLDVKSFYFSYSGMWTTKVVYDVTELYNAETIKLLKKNGKEVFQYSSSDTL